MTKTFQSAADVLRSFKEAMDGADRELWKAACRKEVDDLSHWRRPNWAASYPWEVGIREETGSRWLNAL
ncbi:uncharacterized protein N7458_001051 [Penicillium daleae]|uniref:Uncharacterized protein n=1 Tax=Penicillium daleae TaxID=63821 RepID=A0AAD6CAZ6_9EURO|nr:uncharacterized protein N7458_001051 [Penicillium daleae]KAJ5459499.1 hypothetical protein N7458_001051 [Penicillium daleae]